MNTLVRIQQTFTGASDGYIGIPLSDGQFVNDGIFALILLLFVLFSIMYRRNFRLFLKTVQDFRYVKERQSLFLHSSNNEPFFRNFMTFQTLALSSLFLFSVSRLQGWIRPGISGETALLVLSGLFLILLAYYQFKQLLYFGTGMVFFGKSAYRLWKNGYHAVFALLGVFLYLPVVWLSYVGSYQQVAIWLFIILFILSRFVIIYKIIRIFYRKGDNLLYMILYLCTQEILPLVFLYEGLVYLYNFIETSTLWH